MQITITKTGDIIHVESPRKDNGVVVAGTETDDVRPNRFWGDSRRGNGYPYGWLDARVGQTVEVEDW